MKYITSHAASAKAFWMVVGVLAGVGGMLLITPQPDDLETALLASPFSGVEEVAGTLTSLQVDDDAFVVTSEGGTDFIIRINGETVLREDATAEPKSFTKDDLRIGEQVTVSTEFDTRTGELVAVTVTKGVPQEEEEEEGGYDIS